jgi:CBS domain-containing protein
MNVSDVMHRSVHTCSIDDTLDQIARVMWEHDCGSVPLTDSLGQIVAIITDRDVCMAAYTQGQPLTKIVASSACTRSVATVHENATVETVEKLMRERQVRRIPVVDNAQRPIGIVTLNDLVAHAHPGGRRREGLSAESIAKTLSAICEHEKS